MEMLREQVQYFTDEKLLDIYCNQRDEYVAEAFRVFEEEVAKRGLDPVSHQKAKERTEAATAAANVAVSSLKREDFEPLEYPFSKADAVTANAILHNSKVPYILEKYEMDEGDKDDSEMFIILVYRDALANALELIEEHFEPGRDGKYTLRQSDIADRLKSFSLYDIKFTEKAANEIIDVDFSHQEKSALINLAETLLDEADQIEEKQDRIVFFYDSWDAIIPKLKGVGGFTRTDFLAILELCQIYCDDPRYDHPSLDHVVSSILEFFLS